MGALRTEKREMPAAGVKRRRLERPILDPSRDLPPLTKTELGLDVVTIAIAIATTQLSARATDAVAMPLPWAVIDGLIVIGALAAGGAYRPRFTLAFLDSVRWVLGATAIAAMIVSFFRLLAVDDPQIAGQAARLWLFTTAYMLAGRGGAQLLRARARRLRVSWDPTLIVGAGEVGHHVARRLFDRPEFGLRPVAFLDDDPMEVEKGADLPVYGVGAGSVSETVAGAIKELNVKHVVVAFSRASHSELLSLVRRAREMGASVSLVPRLFEAVPDQTTLERIGGIPLISVHPRNPRGWQFALKYAFDRVLALLALILTSPLLLIAALGTLFTLGRPVLFRQPRVGIDGRAFDMLKFRTMHAGPPTTDRALAEDLERGLAPGGIEGEDRRTAFGAFLRRTSLDELPQFFNVLRGDMSLIGPRPERPEYAERFGTEVHRYGDRLRVKSGITGWAQVHGLRGRTSISDRVEWDNYYIENWSLWLDLKIAFRTFLMVVRRAE
jgi:exopolysaccharide biosynthesis polyprenyl glycosylphosphotransferase